MCDLYVPICLNLYAGCIFFNLKKKSVYVSFKTCNAYFHLLLNRHAKTSANTLESPGHIHKYSDVLRFMYSENMNIAIFDDLAPLKKNKIRKEKYYHIMVFFSLLTIVNKHF